MAIYDLVEQRVRLLHDKIKIPGVYTLQWNGRNENGMEFASGRKLDATYHLEKTEGQYSIVFHSAGGTAGTAAALNRDYAPGLEALLEELRTRRISIADILLDTTRTRDDPLEDRRLNLRGDRHYPLDLSNEEELTDLRLAISAAQGNNPNRRIRIVLGLSKASNIDGFW